MTTSSSGSSNQAPPNPNPAAPAGAGHTYQSTGGTGAASSTTGTTPIPKLPSSLSGWKFETQVAPNSKHPNLHTLVQLWNVAQSTQRSGHAAAPKVVKALEQNLSALGIEADAKDLTHLLREPVGSTIISQLGAEGLKVPNAATVGTLLTRLGQMKQLPQLSTSPQANPANPGAGVPTSEVTAQQMYDNFLQQINDPKQAAKWAATLNAANIDVNPVTASDPGSMAQQFLDLLQQTGNGGNVANVLAKSQQSAGNVQNEDPDYQYIGKLAAQIGVNLTNSEQNALARQYKAMGGTSANDTAAITADVAALYTYDPNSLPAPSSYAASALNSLKDTLGSYAVPVTDAQLGTMMDQILQKGDLTSIYAATDAANAAAEEYGRSMASNLYPTLSPLINQGMNVRSIMSPYEQMIQNTLGQGQPVNWEDPKWMSMMTDPEGNLLSVPQAQAKIMQSPTSGWQYSADAFEKYTALASTLANTLGKASYGPSTYQPGGTSIGA